MIHSLCYYFHETTDYMHLQGIANAMPESRLALDYNRINVKENET